jgi:cytochrome P450
VVEQDVETVSRALAAVSRAFRGFPFPFWLPFPRHVRAWGHLHRLNRLMYRLIDERIRSLSTDPAPQAERSQDLLSLLLAARDEQGRPMSKRQLRDELMTVFLAGHETTAIAMTFSLWLIARHPEVLERLLAEWRDVLGVRGVTAADLPQLEYTRAVLNESMRLYPPAWFIGREAAVDGTIGDFDIPRGTTIFLVPYVLHRDARFFPDPERFDPDRWVNETAPKPPRYAYFPFGAGPRSCIGAGFAMLEMAAVLPTILRRFRLRDLTGGPVELLPAVTLRPKQGIQIGISSRTGDA